jgi:photosystem II stability/assembly factor-like uncharacterized protein
MPPGRQRPGTRPTIVPGLAASGSPSESTRPSRTLLVATGNEVYVMDPATGAVGRAAGLDDRAPTCLAVDPLGSGRAWCGTRRSGVFRSDDGGATWRASGLDGRSIMALAVSPAAGQVVWAGTEPSEVWRFDPLAAASAEGGADRWERAGDLEVLPSSPEWAFPPRPDTHHVRWIACHPHEPGRLWAAIEAGALISTADGGLSWRDRVSGGPFDTHELAIHPAAPETLRVAAGDGYYESRDGGLTWSAPRAGLEVRYLRSVAIHPARPDVVMVSGASGPRSTYVAGRSDGRVYRRQDGGRWERVVHGWPDPPGTIAPLLVAGPGATAGDTDAAELWAADERGVHQSMDGGVTWDLRAKLPTTPVNLRGLVVC